MKATLLILLSVVALMVPCGHAKSGVALGCLPSERLVFDHDATLEESKLLNKRFLDCPNPEPGVPCFYYKDIFPPVFVIEDMVSGRSDKFLGSYTFKVVGGGTSRENIRNYSQVEVLRFNSFNYSAGSRVWRIQDMPESVGLTEGSFIVMNHTFNRISWQCRKDSPCGNLLPRALVNPDFFFLIEVSNNGTDNRPYCKHTSRFELHVHGFPLNPITALYCMLISISSVVLAVTCYVVYNCCWMDRRGLHSWVPQMYGIIYRIIQNPIYDGFITLVVMLDIGLLTAQTIQGVAATRGWFFSVVDACFLGFYVMDVVFKIMLWAHKYFKNRWNVLDFLIVLMSLVQIALSVVQSNGGFQGKQASTVFRVLKMLKGARGLKTLRSFKTIHFFHRLQNILLTCFKSMRSVAGIITLMFMFLLMFSVAFREMFKESNPEYCGNFFRTFFTLFEVLTLDNWNQIYVISSENGASYIMIFLAGYIIVQVFTSLSLFFAVFMDNFQLSISKERTSKSGQSTDVKEGERQPTEKTEAGVKEESYLEALRQTFSESKHSTRKTELVARHLQLLATMEKYHLKYRSQACLQKQLVKTFMAKEDD